MPSFNYRKKYPTRRKRVQRRKGTYRKTKGYAIRAYPQRRITKTGLSYSINGWPDTYTTRLTFSAIHTTPTATPSCYFAVRGNSIYDPDVHNIGDIYQPYGTDQLFNLYTQCFVHSSKIRVTLLQGGMTQNDTNGILTCYPSRSYDDETTIDAMMVRPWCKHTFSGNIYNGKTPTISHFMSSNKMFTVRDKSLAEIQGYECTAGGNPTYPWYWNVQYSTSNGQNLVNGGGAIVYHITYYCTFSYRKQTDDVHIDV